MNPNSNHLPDKPTLQEILIFVSKKVRGAEQSFASITSMSPLKRSRRHQITPISLCHIALIAFTLILSINTSTAQTKSVAELINDLKDQNTSVRSNAARDLSMFGKEAKDAVPGLITALKDQNSSVRFNAVTALIRIGKDAVPALIVALKDRESNVRDSAADALSRIGKEAKEATPALIAALKNKDEDPSNIFTIVSALGHIGKEAVPALIAALKDQDANVRSNAAIALSRIGKEAVPALIVVLKDKEANVRASAAETLGRIRTEAKESVPALSAALQDQDVTVRVNAASALGIIGREAKEAVPALIVALKDVDSRVRSSAAYALSSIGEESKEALPSLIASLKDQDANVRANSVSALSSIGEGAKEAIPALSALIKDQDAHVRTNAAIALSIIGKGSKEAALALIAMLNDQNAEVRSNVISAISNIGEVATDLVPALGAALKDQDANVRSRAAAGLVLRQLLNLGLLIPHQVQSQLVNAAPTLIFGFDGALVTLATKFFDTKNTEVLPELKRVYAVMNDHPNEDIRAESIKVKRTIDYLESLSGERFKERAKKLIGEHYIIAGGMLGYLLLQVFWVFCFWFRPLLLLEVLRKSDKWLGTRKIFGFERPLSASLIIVPWCYYPEKLLNAWIEKYLEVAKKGYSSKLTVKQHNVYVPMPALLNEQLRDSVNAAQLQPLFEKAHVTVLLTGEGGGGKTSLACQMGFWAMEEKSEQRLCKDHSMIPVLIEGNLKAREDKKNPFFIAIRTFLSELTQDKEPLLDELVIQLLKKSRVLVIVDSLSELDETTQINIRQTQDDFLVGALIATSRNKDEVLGGTTKTIINPPRVKGEVLTSFLQNYLCQRLGRDLSEQEDLELFAGCKRLSEIIGEREITILIAKMYAELMLAAKLKLKNEDQPHNLPELMKSYVKTLNDKVTTNKQDTHKVLRVAKLIAWECLRQKLHPSFAKYDEVLNVLKEETNADSLSRSKIVKSQQRQTMWETTP